MHARVPKQKQRAARNARYQQRQRTGRLVVQVEVTPTQIDALEASRWLDRQCDHDRRQIEMALQSLIDASLK
jgi:hypothetical protein